MLQQICNKFVFYLVFIKIFVHRPRPLPKRAHPRAVIITCYLPKNYNDSTSFYALIDNILVAAFAAKVVLPIRQTHCNTITSDKHATGA